MAPSSLTPMLVKVALWGSAGNASWPVFTS
jgi:hypothetical protein